MRNGKRLALGIGAAAMALMLAGCGAVDESVLNTEADYTVAINVPYATATPLPEKLNVPDAIVIDEEGRVSVNDATAIEGEFENPSEQAKQAEYGSLGLGNTGTEVQALQARLQALGYFEGEVSGVYDAATEEAVKRFERTYGTMQTGVATSKLQLKLFAAGAPAYGSEAYEKAVVSQYAVLRTGSVGSAVYALQARLKELGYPVGELDGVYDEETAQSVAAFYVAYGLAGSPVASVAMQKQLYAEDAKGYDASAAMPAALDTALEGADGTAPDGFETLEGAQEEAQDEAAQDGFAAQLDAAAEAVDGSGDAPGEDADRTVNIRAGATGERVKALQARLVEMGYLESAAATGTYDADTQEAVDRFLLMHGMANDGELTPELEALLFEEEGTEAAGTEGGYADLNVGDSGAGVLEAQARLIELGYAAGTADGKYGSGMVAAVKAFQQINDLNADGRLTAVTQEALFSEGAITYEEGKGKLDDGGATETANGVVYFLLKKDAAGSAVKKLQKRLNKLGYLAKEKITGTYDSATESAVKAYQKAMGIEQTGEATASFQSYLYSKAAPQAGIQLRSRETNYPPLAVGDDGEAVADLQQRLVRCGMMTNSDARDSAGVYGETTRAAVERAQRIMGYKVVDGAASAEFQAFLHSRYGVYLPYRE